MYIAILLIHKWHYEFGKIRVCRRKNKNTSLMRSPVWNISRTTQYNILHVILEGNVFCCHSYVGNYNFYYLSRTGHQMYNSFSRPHFPQSLRIIRTRKWNTVLRHGLCNNWGLISWLLFAVCHGTNICHVHRLAGCSEIHPWDTRFGRSDRLVFRVVSLAMQYAWKMIMCRLAKLTRFPPCNLKS